MVGLDDRVRKGGYIWEGIEKRVLDERGGKS